MNHADSIQEKRIRIQNRFDALAQSRDRWIEKNRYYYEDQRKYFRFLIPEDAGVLELGCGTGDLLHCLKPRRGLGIDISGEMISIARRKYPDLEFRVGDIEDLEKIDGTFQYIVLSDVLGLLLDIEKAFHQIRRLCTPDARIAISYYNYLWEPILKLGERMGMKMPQQHQNWLSMADIGNLLFLADFQVVKSETRLLIPKRIPILSRWMNRYLAALPGVRKLCLCYYLVARPYPETHTTDFRVSIVIPCRNEKGNIEGAVRELPEFGVHQEIIFVDGHSTDGTQDEINRVVSLNPDKDIKLMVQKGAGKGDAVRSAFETAAGEILMILDSDLTVHPKELPKFYKAIASGKGEFINGCRLIYPLEKDAMRILNMLGNKFFSLVFSWLLNQSIKDTLCGTKVLFKADYQRIARNRKFFGDFDPFGDFDLLFGASKLNLKIIEIPVRYQARVYGETQIKRFRHGWLLLRMCFFAAFKLKFF